MRYRCVSPAWFLKHTRFESVPQCRCATRRMSAPSVARLARQIRTHHHVCEAREIGLAASYVGSQVIDDAFACASISAHSEAGRSSSCTDCGVIPTGGRSVTRIRHLVWFARGVDAFVIRERSRDRDSHALHEQAAATCTESGSFSHLRWFIRVGTVDNMHIGDQTLINESDAD